MVNPRNPQPATRKSFTIPMFPHVKKFIIKNYNIVGNTIKVSEQNTFGKMIVTALLDNRTRSTFNDQYRDRLTESLTIVLTSELAQMVPRLGKLKRINLHVDALYKEHLLCWINALRSEGHEPYTVCRMFIAYYNLEEKDLDTIYRWFQRNCDRKPANGHYFLKNDQTFLMEGVRK